MTFEIENSEERLITLGSVIKSYGKSDDGREIIGGYLAVWGSSQRTDLHEEHFKKTTNFDSPIEHKPVLYHHGLSADVHLTKTGDIFALEKDETGLAVKAYLGLRIEDMREWEQEQIRQYQEYIEAIKHLVQRDVLRWSGGALPQGVVVDESGFIRAFPLIEGSLTFSPAEPSQTTRVIPIKALIPTTLKDAQSYARDGANSTSTSTTTTSTTTNSTTTNSTNSTDSTNNPNNTAKELNAMNAQEICAAVIAKLREAGIDIPSEMEAALMEQFTPMAEEIAAETKADNEEEPMTEEEKSAVVDALVKAVVGKVKQQLTTYRRTSVAERAGQKAASIIAGNTPNSALDSSAAYRSGGQDPTKRGTSISMKSRRWGDMTPEDMSFYLCYERRRRHNPAWLPVGEDGVEFFREVANKTYAAWEKGTVRFEEDLLRENMPKAIKAIHAMKSDELNYSTQSGYGDEWVPDLWASQVWERMRLDNLVAPAMRVVEMPSNPFELPVESTDPTVYFVPETTNESQLLISGSGAVIPDSKLATAKVTLTAKKLALRVGYSTEQDEDSIIPFVSQLRNQAQRSILNAIDNVAINGDTETGGSGNINKDDGAPTATDKYLAFNGLRKLPLVTATTLAVNGGGAAPTLNLIRSARSKLADAYGARPDELMLLCDYATYIKMLGMDEFLTMEKAGALATAQKGILGFVDGIAVAVSSEMSRTEADGKINGTPSATTFGQIVIFHKFAWVFGYRRNVTVDVSYLPYLDSYQLSATVRLALINRDNTCASVLYNLAV